jgi:hypothetical protein
LAVSVAAAAVAAATANVRCDGIFFPLLPTPLPSPPGYPFPSRPTAAFQSFASSSSTGGVFSSRSLVVVVVVVAVIIAGYVIIIARLLRSGIRGMMTKW